MTPIVGTKKLCASKYFIERTQEKLNKSSRSKKNNYYSIKLREGMKTLKTALFSFCFHGTWRQTMILISYDFLCYTVWLVNVNNSVSGVFNIKQSSLKRYGARMTKFSTNPYFIFQRFNVTLHSFSRNCFSIKIKFFTSISKSVVTYITITVRIISNSIIKQYYGIIKLFKALVIVEKKQFSRTNILI